MPNWVDNSITVSTNNPVLIDLLVKVNETYLKDTQSEDFPVFETIRPIGEWDYDKACEAWGCKWDLGYGVVTLKEHTDGWVDFNVTGQTPWCSPDNLRLWLLETFNNDGFNTSVTVRWLEEGGEWGVYENEELVSTGFVSVKDKLNHNTTVWHAIGNELDLENFFEGLFEDEEDEENEEV